MQGQKQVQIQTQKLMLTQTLRQSLELLNYSSQELDLHLQYKLQENPLLKVRSKTPINFSNEVTERIPKKVSIIEILNEQLLDFNLSEEVTKVVHWLINDLNRDGLLTHSPEEYALLIGTSTSNVIKAISILQKCEPIGLGASSIQEAFLIQANHNEEPKDMIHLITHYFDLFIDKNWLDLSRQAKISLGRIQEIADKLAYYSTSPLGQLRIEQSPYILPEATITVQNSIVSVKYYEYAFPNISYDSNYIKNISSELDHHTLHYLEMKKKEIEDLTTQLSWRKETIQRIIEEVVSFQSLYFIEGPSHLIPLTMTDLAARLDVHESTISRAVREKYINTPFGIVPIKTFFSQAATDNISTAHVKSRMRKFIKDENKSKPISDQVIVEMLQKEGIRLSRRVIAKYREQLLIPNSTKRKRFEET